MTDSELDELIQRVLTDSLIRDWSKVLDRAPPLKSSKSFQNRIKAMLHDPFAWYLRKTRPIWKKVMQTAAAILLVISVGFGFILLANPIVVQLLPKGS